MTNLRGFDRRRLLLQAGLTALAASTGCGYLLYPERKGRTAGRIDVGVLVIDLLWLIPGVIPGVICLIVDYTTGCIYEAGGSAARDPADNAKSDALAVASVSVDGDVVASGAVKNDRRGELEWRQSLAGADVHRRGRLTVTSPSGQVAEARIADLVPVR